MNAQQLIAKEKMRLIGVACSAYGFKDFNSMLGHYILEGVMPAVCLDCDHTEELEPDQEHGWCEACNSNEMVSAAVLAGVI